MLSEVITENDVELLKHVRDLDVIETVDGDTTTTRVVFVRIFTIFTIRNLNPMILFKMQNCGSKLWNLKMTRN